MTSFTSRLQYAMNSFVMYLGNYSLLTLISPRPHYAEIRVTESCNSRCITCNAWKNSQVSELTTLEMVDALAQLKDIGVNIVRLSGGEPLIRVDISEIVKGCRSLAFEEIHIATNGILLEEKAKALVESGATRFDVSLDGIGEINDRIRGTPGHYSIVLRGIQKVKTLEKEFGRKIPVTVFTTLLKQNLSQIPALVENCERIGVRWCFSLLCGNLDFFKEVGVSKLAVDDWKMVDQTFDYLKKMYNIKPWLIYSSPSILDYSREYIKGNIDPHEFPCTLGYNTINLGSRGEVYPGCYVYKPAGYTREQKIKTILKSRDYRRLVEKMYRKECSGCTFYFENSIMIRNMFQRPEVIRKLIRSGRS